MAQPAVGDPRATAGDTRLPRQHSQHPSTGTEHADAACRGLLARRTTGPPIWPASWHQRSEQRRLAELLAAAGSKRAQQVRAGGGPVVAAARPERLTSGWTSLGGRTLALAKGQRLQPLAAGLAPRADSAASLRPCARALIALRRSRPASWHRWTTADGQPRAAGKSWPKPFEPRDQQATPSTTLFSPLRQRLPELMRAMPALVQGPFPQAPADLPDAGQQGASGLELLQAGGSMPRKAAAGTLAPIPFFHHPRPADSAHQPGGSGQPFSASWRQPRWGHSLYEQGLPRQDNPNGSRLAAGRWPLRWGVHESRSLFWECRVARSEPSPALATRIAQALTARGSLFQALKPAPAWAEPGGGR